MFIRALSIALWCACAAALTPLSAVADDNECALYLSGPGRTSSYDYSLNLLKGNFGYEGQHTCITYDAVNQAYLDARNRIVVSQPKGDWKAEDFASVGELILDISISLARTYGLTYEEIEKGLPLIDTSRTLIREVCPPVFSHVECRAGKYRRLDGLCNNLQHPTWGATMAPFQRLIGPLFADGINAPRISHTGRDLPLSRVVSRTMHPDEGFHDHAGTVMVIAWGQFMDHDYTLTGTPLDPVNRNDPEECCKRPPHLKHPYCNEIRVPEDDYFYRLFGVQCIDFVRGFPSPRPGCRLGSRVPFNTLTGAIDGNTVYGVTEKFARKLRTGYGGLLRMNPVFKEYGLRDLLPLKLDIPDEGCTRPNKNMYCFEAGEIRVNEQLVLTVMHTLMAREHNRVANALAEVNPHWDDETLFQEARRINIAEIQHITYNEFLPILLGKDVMEKFGLVVEKEGYWDGYDPEVNPDVLDSFAAAAYRFGHSLLPTAVERWSKAHKFIASKRLSDLIRRPYDLYRAGVLDEYVMGLMNQVAQAMDDSITQEVTNHLFKKVGARFGMDLVSFNMQRGREFGLPGYMEFRKFCGLPGAESFQDLFGTMSNETVRKYESIFEHPIDVDLWSGGVSERPLPGSMLGPTFACVIATQFSYSRRGDRFWYELPNQPSTFTPEQLTEIRKARLARVICDNTDIIDTVQLYPMVLPDHELNPRVPCRSGIIPSIDFTKWAEPAPFHGTAKQFMTEAYAINKNCTGNEQLLETTPTNISTPASTIKNTIHSSVTSNDCNTTQPLQSDINALQASVNIKTDKITTNTVKDSPHNIHNANNHQANQKENEVDSNTVLKYVYKSNDKVSTTQKSMSHPLNRLRKKRSTDNVSRAENITVGESKNAPLIVNYETLHPPEGSLNQRLTGGSIRNSDLADFHIETVHKPDSASVKNNENVQESSSSQSNEASDEKGRSSEESIEQENYSKSKENDERDRDYSPEKENRSDYRDNETREESSEKSASQEKDEYYKNLDGNSHRNSDKDNDDDDNRNYNQQSRQLKPHSGESYERFSKKNEDGINSGENSDSDEHYRSPRLNESEAINKKSEFKNDKPIQNIESVEHDDSYESQKSDKAIKLVNEDSIEQDDNKKIIKNINEYPKDKDTVDTKDLPASFQDVDLGDFSFERIQVNDKGQVVPAHEGASPSAFKNQEKKSNFEQKNSTLASEKIYDPFRKTSFENVKEPVNINDGEIKPVVEINSENNESDEEHAKETLKGNSEESTSLESLLGSEYNVSSQGNDKIILEKNEDGKTDVKQDFERIPLNYNHDNKNILNEKDIQNKLNDEHKERPDEASNDEGTFTPENINFDENLKFKFDDIQIKLPEIKLPEDVLAYPYEGSTYTKDNKNKNAFYDYRDEIDPQRRQGKNKHDNEDDDDNDDVRYQGYHGTNNQKYKKEDDYDDDEKDNEENDKDYEDEDLYEKFVRERFGKKGSFQKRTENLQDGRIAPKNEKLYDTVKNILKQTQDIKKQAEKSGDPKAGYMWTLEYGENL